VSQSVTVVLVRPLACPSSPCSPRGRQTRCPTDRSAPTGRWPDSTASGACRGGSRRYPVLALTPAPPASFVPHQLHRIGTVRNVPRRVITFCLAELGTTQPGQAAAAGSAVTTCTSRCRQSAARHATPRTTGSPSNYVVPCSKPCSSRSCCVKHSDDQAKGPPQSRRTVIPALLTAKGRQSRHCSAGHTCRRGLTATKTSAHCRRARKSCRGAARAPYYY
jgi:hypothetical protein